MRKKQAGFTVIELMTAIVIIALLIGIGLPNLASARTRANSANVKANAHTAQVMVQTYANDNVGKCPENVTVLWTAASAGGYWKLMSNPFDKAQLALSNESLPAIAGAVAYEPAGVGSPKFYIYGYDNKASRLRQWGKDFVLTNG